jgi:hypothetical protein
MKYILHLYQIFRLILTIILMMILIKTIIMLISHQTDKKRLKYLIMLIPMILKCSY